MESREEKEHVFIIACQTHSDELFRFCCFKLSNREKAKDLVQDTFMKTWTYLTGGHDIGNMRAFFYRTLNNLIIDEYRKNKQVSLDLLMEAGFDYGIDDVKRLEEQLDGAHALVLLRQIPKKYRDVIFMRYVQELSLSEISHILSESENSIAVKIHRGIKKVKVLFDHEI